MSSLVVLVLVAVLGPLSVVTTRAVGPALYPDLRTAKPSNLYFSRATISGSSHYVLRFSNIVWNAGEGRLEIQGDPNPSGSNKIYQNLYDTRSGGTRVIQRHVSSDLIYHPSHYHYHFQGFASYLLLQRDAAGVYKATTKKGTKTSFCIMDTHRMTSSAGSSLYASCGNSRQGLTVGWGDNYPASLPEQWIDLGTSPLPDGAYAIQSTADPQNKLDEAGRDSNNVGLTYFSVRGGAIYLGSTPSAACGASPTSVTVGSTTTLTCSTFRAGERVNIYLDSTSSAPLASTVASPSGALTQSVSIPEARAGSHSLIAVGASSGSRATGGFSVKPSLTRYPSGGPSGTYVTVTAHGFGSGETVKLNWNSPSGTTLAQLNTDGLGKGVARIRIPVDTEGWHDYTGFGYTSRLRAYGAIQVLPGSGYPPGTANPQFTGSRLAIDASSGSSIASSSTNVHDGSTATTWETTNTTPGSAFFTLDLGTTRALTGVKWIYSAAGSNDEVLIQTSLDGSSWRTVGRYGNAPAGSWYGVALDREGRFVRFTYLNPNGDAVLGYLAEAEVWGAATATAARVATAPETPAETPTPTPTVPPTTEPTPTPTDDPAPEPTNTQAPTATLDLTVTPQPTPEPTAEPTLPPVLVTGTITGTDGEGAICRSAPSRDSERLTVLPEGSPVGITGNAVDDFYPVICAGQTGYVSFSFVTLPGQEQQQAPPPNAETEPATGPDVDPTPTPVLTQRAVTIPVSGDTSVTAAAPDTAQPVEQRDALVAGGADGAIAVLTFEVSGVAAGTVVEAHLVLPGAGDSAPGGTLAVLPNTWVDAERATYTAVTAAGPAAVTEVGTIAAGASKVVDVTGVVTSDGTVTFVLYGSPEQAAVLASSEAGNPATLVLTVAG